jgi:hypothetical protein
LGEKFFDYYREGLFRAASKRSQVLICFDGQRVLLPVLTNMPKNLSPSPSRSQKLLRLQMTRAAAQIPPVSEVDFFAAWHGRCSSS